MEAQGQHCHKVADRRGGAKVTVGVVPFHLDVLGVLVIVKRVVVDCER